jgi:hypothetical protein
MCTNLTTEADRTNLVQHPVQLVTSFADSLTIITIHNENQALCVLEVVPPQWSDLQTELGVHLLRHPPENLQVGAQTHNRKHTLS